MDWYKIKTYKVFTEEQMKACDNYISQVTGVCF